MDYIAVNELKKPRMVRERLETAEELVLTNNGRPMAVIMYVGEGDDPEDVLAAARDARSRIALRRIRERARQTGASALSAAAVSALVSKVRRERTNRG
jgi:PHD/YefM family antitoxin component YafN of YafNO toxin-antitoxin module